MAYVIMVDTPDMTAELFEKSSDIIGLGDTPPDGCLVHIAGQGPDGWRVVAVWESLEKAQHFIKTSLQPAQAQLGIAQGPKPPVIWQLYKLEVDRHVSVVR